MDPKITTSEDLEKAYVLVRELYAKTRAQAKIIATSEFNRVWEETDDPFLAMEAYNTVMENLTGNK